MPKKYITGSGLCLLDGCSTNLRYLIHDFPVSLHIVFLKLLSQPKVYPIIHREFPIPL